MSFPNMVNEVCSAIHAVINVIAWSVIKVLPVLIAMLVALIIIDILIGSVFQGEAQTAPPFLSGSTQHEIQLTAAKVANTSQAAPE